MVDFGALTEMEAERSEREELVRGVVTRMKDFKNRRGDLGLNVSVLVDPDTNDARYVEMTFWRQNARDVAGAIFPGDTADFAGEITAKPIIKRDGTSEMKQRMECWDISNITRARYNESRVNIKK